MLLRGAKSKESSSRSGYTLELKFNIVCNIISHENMTIISSYINVSSLASQIMMKTSPYVLYPPIQALLVSVPMLSLFSFSHLPYLAFLFSPSPSQ